jgi:hypothetical protein
MKIAIIDLKYDADIHVPTTVSSYNDDLFIKIIDHQRNTI